MVESKVAAWAIRLGIAFVTWGLGFACGARTPLETGAPPASVDERLRPPRDTQRVVFETVDKVDLLFVIDNSSSMADKQALLRDAVPILLERLINPPCISIHDRNDVVEVAGPEASCPAGYTKEFEPLIDLHVGVITSSLGGHGGEICSPNAPQNYDPTQNDRAWLLGAVRPGVSSYDAHGFLAWDPAETKRPPGESDVGVFMRNFQAHVVAAGETGCGYEATQEAWYRFLVEPDPYLDVVSNGMSAIVMGTDETLLAQRAAFMRPDSLLMVVVLSDEDDCSVVDGNLGWLTAQVTTQTGAFRFPAATSACERDPNDSCCRSCGLNEPRPPAGCAALTEDPLCQAQRSTNGDSLNLRCFDQKRRFGIDLLYPVERYAAALTEPTVFDTRNCEQAGCPQVPNPLFTGIRDASLIVYTAIVGVPWQDIATADSLTGPGLEYLASDELDELNRWQMLLGDPDTGAPPSDPLMIVSPEPRTGTHPITLEPLGAPESTVALANSINGHEYFNNDNSDLQYACIFPIAPRDCSEGGEAACDCSQADLAQNRPLCHPPGGGAPTTTQHYGKAYPGPRHLEVARQLGSTASIASICPKLSQPPTSAAAYGYSPAANHMYERLAGGLGERCLSQPLPHTNDGRAECVLWQLSDTACDCKAAGLEEVELSARASVEQMLRFECAFRQRECETMCACQVPQLSGRELSECQTNAVATGINGWCSIDPSQGVGSSEFVSDCRAGQPRTLRLLGTVEALKDNHLLLTCPE